MHWSGDHKLWDRRNHRVELKGNAQFHQPGETLKADRITIDLKNRKVDAVGNCTYWASDTLINADEIHFDLDTRVGTIIGGKVTNGRYQLTGERINKLGQKRFQTHRAEYTTCRNCPQDWTFSGEDVDIEFEGYAKMSNVTAKVMGAPVLWIPYMIIPVKTQRQSGLLFPRLGSSTNHGFQLVQPLFWSINRSADMTFGVGRYFRRGNRFEWEGRYALTDRSKGQANFFFTRDSTFRKGTVEERAPTPNRWALDVRQSQRLPFGIDQKLRLLDVSDNRYPVDFDDVPGRGQPVIASDLILSHSTSQVSNYIAFRRYRNLLDFENPTGFDSNTVQLFPRAVLTTNDRLFFGGRLAGGLTLRMSHFARAQGPFDYDLGRSAGEYIPGIDPIRKGTRFSVTPSVYTTWRPGDIMWVVPSVQYRGYFYSFHNALPNLSRGYLLFQTEVGTQFEKIYDWPDPDMPKIKHTLRPTLTYSYIPYILQPDHPFLRQIDHRSGYNFDNSDIVPIDASKENLVNYFEPLGNSISYGLNTQVIRRIGAMDNPSARYETALSVSAGQSLNFREFDRPSEERAPFSRFYALSTLSLDRLRWSLDYYYYPHLDVLLPGTPENERSPHWLSTRLTYIFERGLRQEILTFDRSITAGLTRSKISGKTFDLSLSGKYSINDYFLPGAEIVWNAVKHEVKNWQVNATYQPPSMCWRVSAYYAESVDRKGYDIGFDLMFNLTGGGFSGVGDFASSIVGPQ